MSFRKIINDPVYGFITIDDELIAKIIAHPYYQRLRHIHQMAMAHLVYPGAVHTRLHHSLGAYHLMCMALTELKSKGVDISASEEQAAKIAILLHDIGHGPFSHALESVLIESMHHEAISLLLMKDLNQQFDGRLQLAIDIFTNTYPKGFLYQLISGQLDLDRMDYLIRDSFFTGVSEGVIGYDRILKMLTVHNGELVVEEKGIYSIEKFLVARRLMYWQVYLHKTVLCAEQMLQRIVKRAKQKNVQSFTAPTFNTFIHQPHGHFAIETFTKLDDVDVLSAIKEWSNHNDVVLSTLCQGIRDRNLLKVQYFPTPINEALIQSKRAAAITSMHLAEEDADWLVFTGEATSSMYNLKDEHINILLKTGEVKDISMVHNALIAQNLHGKIKKYYICYLR